MAVAARGGVESCRGARMDCDAAGIRPDACGATAGWMAHGGWTHVAMSLLLSASAADAPVPAAHSRQTASRRR
eukprot:4240613-Prymnesium_polylepis.1